MPLHSITCKRYYRHNHPNRKGSVQNSSYKVLCHKIPWNQREFDKRECICLTCMQITHVKHFYLVLSVKQLSCLWLFACTSTLFRRQNGLSSYVICIRKNWSGNRALYWANPQRELKTWQWWPSKQNFRKIKSHDSLHSPYTVQFDYFDKLSH